MTYSLNLFEPATAEEATESTPEEKAQPDVPAVPLPLPTEKAPTQLPAQTAEARSTDDGDNEAAEERREAEVVSLDAFRKK